MKASVPEWFRFLKRSGEKVGVLGFDDEQSRISQGDLEIGRSTARLIARHLVSRVPCSSPTNNHLYINNIPHMHTWFHASDADRITHPFITLTIGNY